MAKFDAITASLRTDTGRVRGHNEDFVGSWEPDGIDEQSTLGWLYVVADGVGGAQAGDVASQTATEKTIEQYVSSEQESSADRLMGAVKAANDTLRQLSQERGRGGYMATTICAAVFRNGRVLFVNVGDSRGYLLRNGKLTQITNDHSLVAQLVAEGAITPEEAAVHPRRNVILSSLGPMREPQIDLFDIEVEQNDIVVLCSDGLIRHVSDEEIAEIALSEDPDVATETLIAMANARGGTDNISVALLRIDPAEIEADLATRPRVVSTLSDDLQLTGMPQNRWGLRIWTLILAITEAILIILVYYWLRV